MEVWFFIRFRQSNKNRTTMNEAIEKAFSELLELCKTNIQEKDHAKIEDAFGFVHEVFGERCWESGEMIVVHSIDVAKIVVQEIGLGVDSAVSALLHNVYYQDQYDKEIETRFGKSVASILDGMAKINAMGTDTVELHSENYRKLMLGMAGDVRVILLKIADRLQAVSYTHLRAHETRHDLVCRLLLEKKKKKTTKKSQ